jgi:hypothetical protein
LIKRLADSIDETKVQEDVLPFVTTVSPLPARQLHLLNSTSQVGEERKKKIAAAVNIPLSSLTTEEKYRGTESSKCHQLMIMEATPEQSAEGLAIVRVLSAVLDRLVHSNAPLARTDPGQVTKFHAMKAPGIGIQQYLERYISVSPDGHVALFLPLTSRSHTSRSIPCAGYTSMLPARTKALSLRSSTLID